MIAAYPSPKATPSMRVRLLSYFQAESLFLSPDPHFRTFKSRLVSRTGSPSVTDIHLRFNV